MGKRILTPCWRYGESEEAGYEPYLAAGDVVELAGESFVQRGNGLEVTPVRTADGRIEMVLSDNLEDI